MHTSKNIPRTTNLETFLISVDIGVFRVHTASLSSAVKLELAAYRRAGEVRAVELYADGNPEENCERETAMNDGRAQREALGASVTVSPSSFIIIS